MNFKWLLCLGGQKQFPCNDDRRTDIQLCNVLIIGKLIRFEYDLYPFKAASIIQINEAKRFGIPNGSRPTAYGDNLSAELFHSGIELFNLCSLQNSDPPVFRAQKASSSARFIHMFLYYNTSPIGASKIFALILKNIVKPP